MDRSGAAMHHMGRRAIEHWVHLEGHLAMSVAHQALNPLDQGTTRQTAQTKDAQRTMLAMLQRLRSTTGWDRASKFIEGASVSCQGC